MALWRLWGLLPGLQLSGLARDLELSGLEQDAHAARQVLDPLLATRKLLLQRLELRLQARPAGHGLLKRALQLHARRELLRSNVHAAVEVVVVRSIGRAGRSAATGGQIGVELVVHGGTSLGFDNS